MSYNYNPDYNEFDMLDALAQLPKEIYERINQIRNQGLERMARNTLLSYIYEGAETEVGARRIVQEIADGRLVVEEFVLNAMTDLLIWAEYSNAESFFGTPLLPFEAANRIIDENPEALSNLKNCFLELNMGVVVRVISEELTQRAVDREAPMDRELAKEIYDGLIRMYKVEDFAKDAEVYLPMAIRIAAENIQIHDDPEWYKEFDVEPDGQQNDPEFRQMIDRELRKIMGADFIERIIEEGPKDPKERGDENSQGGDITPS